MKVIYVAFLPLSLCSSSIVFVVEVLVLIYFNIQGTLIFEVVILFHLQPYASAVILSLHLNHADILGVVFDWFFEIFFKIFSLSIY